MISQELYAGCAANETAAWTHAYNYILVYLKKNSTQTEAARDIAQDTLLYFINGGLKKVKNPKAFKSLLRLKTYHITIEYFRKDSKRKESPLEPHTRDGKNRVENPEPAMVIPSFETRLESFEILVLVEDALGAMDKTCAEILKAYFKGVAQGHKVREIAESRQMKPNTFSVQVSKCRKKLEKHPNFKTLLALYRKN